MRGERDIPARALTALLAHLVITALTFGAILVLAWCASYLIDWFHAMRPFPPETYRFLAGVSLWLVYVDVAVSAMILLIGTTRFIQTTWEAR